jgi:HEAT repeat protein
VWRVAADARAAVPVLAEALHDDSKDVRLRAADVLGQVGAAAAGAVPSLTRALHDDDKDVRAAAAEALKKISDRQAAGAAVVPLSPKSR